MYKYDLLHTKVSFTYVEKQKFMYCPFQQRPPIPDYREVWEIELVSWSGLHKLFVILICDHQERHNKDELTRGAGGRIKEAEDNFVDECFIELGENRVFGMLRVQEDRYQKTIAVLSDEVSIIVMSGHWISLWLPTSIATCILSNCWQLIWDISNFISTLQKHSTLTFYFSFA